MTALFPDRAQLDRFVAVLFRHCDPDTYLVLKAYFHDGREEPVFHARGVKLGDPARGDEVERWAGVAAAAGRPAAFCPPVCTFRDARTTRGYWAATKHDVANGPALSEDADKAPQATRAALVALLGPPTLEVASGGVWVDPETGELQDKLHLHWRLREPTRTAEDHKRLERSRRLAAKLAGADATNAPLSHPLRWAGAVHNKDPDAPRHARIVAETDSEIDLDEALGALEAAWGDRPVPEGDGRGSEPEAEWGDVEAALAVIPNSASVGWDQWKETAMAVYRATAGGGFGLFEAWSAKCEKHEPEACEVAWEQVERSPPDRIGFGSLVHRARQAEPGWLPPSQRFDPNKWFENEKEPLFGEDRGSGAASAARFVFETFDQAADRALADGAPFLVKGLLDLGAMSVVYGDSNVGKTFVVMQIEHCIATGRTYGGKKVRQGAVLHIFTEGARGGRKRAEALRRSVGPAPLFYMLFGNVDLFDPSADIGPLIKAIADLGVSFCLIVIDTLARAMGGGDENLAKDMGAFVRNVDRLRKATGAHAMLVHHSGKDASKGARGSGALRAATDTEIEVTEGRISATKQRDIDKSWTSTFSLRVVELGRDEDGDHITSCTVRLGADAEAAGEADNGMAEVEEVRELSRLVALLKAVEGEPKATVRRLGEVARVPKSTVGKMLGRLQKDRLVAQVLGTWELTPKGVKYLADAT